jgi:hypothetical protein
MSAALLPHLNDAMMLLQALLLLLCLLHADSVWTLLDLKEKVQSC